MANKSIWFHKFLFYDFYFDFKSPNALNIFYSSKRFCICDNLFFQQNIYSQPLLSYAH